MGRATVCELCKKPSPATFLSSGAFYAGLLGALVGTIAVGPHFVSWSLGEIAATVAACALVFAVTASVFLWIFCEHGEGCDADMDLCDASDTGYDWGDFDD
ncbi:hypothetical protein KY495_06655 [Massilia sp. PAMC28688]|uniref:hypothetical protein n=1 Tax=Massilia sp. PAMC28688 TaxID=2861283 RepID=UPI001C63565B|nr:hypothetical protein [Massilia sp. PAMC28688]QYF94859.1 hypothetical protein KY495_06655 [Massilia sp. PAMC28688]